ncbi:MAG: tripartite tricarboxylate transporter substrate binding protein [Xanthobacteraceae bacterium]|nr:tripartite tricarboxylate transporter substrate binding protein [Xanthobacteraceae bacterium]
MRVAAGLLCALLAVACGSPVQAQSYPTKPLRLIVPYAPGGFADVAARIVAEKLQQRLGQQVIVENRSGGNGFIGTTAGAKASPDGYTLLVAHTGEFAVSPAVFKDIPFELERDFESITMISIAPLLVAANAKSPIQSIPDLIKTAKAKPNAVGMGTPGTASINHLAGEWFADAAGIKLLHVPYKGGAPAGVAVAAGEVPMGVMAISSVMAQIQAGRVKPLAVTTAKRSAQYKDWPTLQEVGNVKDVDASIWTGLFAPKGTPKPILDRLHAEMVAILAMPDVREKFAQGGADTGGMSPAEFVAIIKREAAAYRTIVEKANIKPE